MRKTTLRLLMTVIAVVGFAFYGNAQYLTEDFESGAIPAGWTSIQETGTTDWTYSDGAGGGSITNAHGGSFNARFNAPTDDVTKLVTPELDLSSATNPQINFWHAQEDWYGDQDELRLYYKTSAAGAWILIQEWTGNLDTWTEETILLPNPSATYYVAFEGTDGYGRDVVFDDIIIEEAPNCPAPTAQAVSDILTTSVTLSWTSGDSESAWNVEYGATGYTQGTGTTVAATDTFINITGLTAQTDYDFYVQADCGGDQSTWTGPFTFTTACDAINIFPYTEDYDGGWDCWSVVNNDADSYEWSQDDDYITPHSGAYVAHGMGNNDDYLISPQFTLNAGMEIKWWDVVESASYNNTYDVLLSTTTSDIASFTVNLGTFDCTNTDWVEHVINLTGYTGNVYIAFHQTYSAASYYGFGIDDFLLQDGPTCFVPTDLDVQNLGATSADLAWTTGGATEWGVLFGVSPFDTIGVASSVTTNNPLTVDTLTAETSYEYYVRDICGAGDSSVWAGPFTFTTTASCPAPTDLTATGITSTAADLGWNGYAATNWDILFGQAGFDTTGMAITADDISTNPLTVDTLQPATTYEFYVRADCGQDNIDTSVWVGPFSFMTECENVVTYPYVEDFEGSTFLPVCWSKDLPGSGNDITQSSTENHTTGGTYSARFSSYSSSSDYNQYLITPVFTIDANYPELSFWYAMSNDDTDTLSYGIVTSTDTTWVGVDRSYGAWSQETHDLSSYVGQDIYFVFHYYGDFAYYVYFDDFKIDEALVTDLALVMPGNENYYDCNFTGTDTIPFFVENVGDAVVSANDTIFAWYELDGAAAVADTFIIATDLNPTDTLMAAFAQTGNLAGLTTHDFKVYFEYEPGTDMNQVNDTTVGTVTHYMATVDLGGVNDTITVPSYPYTLDAGANFDAYLWNDGSMNQTLDVSVDGWYDVLVTDTNGCDAFDSVYVQLTIGINTIDGISLNIYPNPNKGEFTLNANFNSTIDFTVEIVNLNGKTIYTKEFNGVDAINEAIDIDEYSKGVYYIRIVNSDFVKQEKVIVY